MLNKAIESTGESLQCPRKRENRGAGVKAENITMTLQYLNADGTVLYEGAYTYADLAAAVKPAA